MSERREVINDLRKKAEEVKKEFDNEIDTIIKEITMDKNIAADNSNVIEEKQRQDKLVEYEKKFETLKEELKSLKKIKKRQKKISKLEEERMYVLNEIERNKGKNKGLKKHK